MARADFLIARVCTEEKSKKIDQKSRNVNANNNYTKKEVYYIEKKREFTFERIKKE